MSRYGMNKVIRDLTKNPSPADVELFEKDPERFLANRELTPDEKRAFVDRDLGTLYRLGAHPFILQSWGRRFSIGEPRTFEQRYVAAISPHGYPDYAT